MENDQLLAVSEESASTPTPAAWQQRVDDEIEVLRWCIDWLEQLEQGRPVVFILQSIVHVTMPLSVLTHDPIR